MLLTLTPFLYVLGGGLGGFLLYRLVGCKTGACLIAANPYVSILYGMLIGFFLFKG